MTFDAWWMLEFPAVTPQSPGWELAERCAKLTWHAAVQETAKRCLEIVTNLKQDEKGRYQNVTHEHYAEAIRKEFGVWRLSALDSRESVARRKPSPDMTMDAVESALKALGSATAADIIKATGSSHEHVYERLVALEAAGKARIVPHKAGPRNWERRWEWMDGVDIDAVHKR